MTGRNLINYKRVNAVSSKKCAVVSLSLFKEHKSLKYQEALGCISQTTEITMDHSLGTQDSGTDNWTLRLSLIKQT